MADLMISFAQNQEDVLLDRLFPRDHKGLFIDVGANHPMHCSVTKHFYDLGWTGINIEPARVFDELAAKRPRDINMQVAVSDEDGEATFYEFSKEYSTDSTLDTGVASENDRFAEHCTPRKVQVRSLRSIFAEHVGPRVVDFLSIDVEGHEEKVIRGADWKACRPRVVVVESTRPHRREMADIRWERHLLAADYLFAFFDGLNRYYVRAEDPHFLELLSTPVCIFDEYVSLGQVFRFLLLQRQELSPDTKALVDSVTRSIAANGFDNRVTHIDGFWWLLKHRLKQRFPTAIRLLNRTLRRSA